MSQIRRRRKMCACKKQPSQILRGHQFGSAAFNWYSAWIMHECDENKSGWPQLQPPMLEPLPEFPLETLPGMVRQWVLEVSRMTQTPIDLAAMIALATGSAAAGNRTRIIAREGWSEPTSLFAAVLVDGGPQQASVFSEALRPVREWEAQVRNVARADDPADDNPRDESTPISRFLGDVPDRMYLPSPIEHGATASLTASGGVLHQMAGRNNLSLREQARVFAAGFDGEPLTLQRTAKRFVEIARPAVACGLTIRPSVVEGMAKSPKFPGNSLLERFLFAMPERQLGKRDIAPPAVSKYAQGGWRASIRNLLTIEQQCDLTLSPEAEQLFRAWETEIEPQLDAGLPEGVHVGRTGSPSSERSANSGTGCQPVLHEHVRASPDLHGMSDWGARLPGATLRIAAILHLFDNGADVPVSDDVMSSAIAIGRYLIPHARAALETMGAIASRPESDHEYLIRWLHARSQQTISLAEAHQGTRRRFDSHALKRAMEGLATRGYVRPLEVQATGKPGRPKLGEYEVNPAMFAPASSEESAKPTRPDFPWFDFAFPGPIFGGPTEPEVAANPRIMSAAERAAFRATMERTYRDFVAVDRSIRRKKERLARIEKKNGGGVQEIRETLGKVGAAESMAGDKPDA